MNEQQRFVLMVVGCAIMPLAIGMTVIAVAELFSDIGLWPFSGLYGW